MSKIYRHSFTAHDGTKVPLTIYVHPENTKTAVLLPGLGAPAELYTLAARYLRDLGVNIILTELRGQGESTPSPSAASDWGIEKLVHDDVHQCVTIARKLFKEHPIYLIGHSIGGMLSLLYASQHEPEIAGVAALASGVSYYKDYGISGTKIIAAAVGVRGVIAAKGYKPPTKWEKYGDQSAKLMLDWTGLSMDNNWKFHDTSTYYPELLEKMNVPVLNITFEGDKDITNAANHRLMKLLTQSTREDLTITNEPPLGHSGWIINPQTTVQEIYRWIVSLSSSAA